MTLAMWLDPSMCHLLVMHVSSCVLEVSLFLLSFSDHSLSSLSASHLARYEGITDWNVMKKEGSLSLCLLDVSIVMGEACSDPGSVRATLLYIPK